MIALVLTDLAVPEPAISAWRAFAATGGEAARAEAEAAIAEIHARPPITRDATDRERRRALLLFRDGVDQRMKGDHETALKQLRRSFALSPHPYTVVQIGMAHLAAGRAAQGMRSSARALAMAEATRGATATPVIAAGHNSVVAWIGYLDANTLVTAGHDSRAIVWNPAIGSEEQNIPTGHPTLGGAVSRDRRVIALLSPDQKVHLWQVPIGDHRTLSAKDGAMASAAAFSPDGKLIATGDVAGSVSLWNVDTGERVRRLSVDLGQVASLDFRPGGSGELIVGALAGVWIVRAADGVEVAQLRGSTPVAYSSNGERLVYGRDGGLVLAGAEGTEIRTVATNDRPLQVRFAAGDRRLVVLHRDGGVATYDLEGRLVHQLGGAELQATSIDVSPDGTRIAVSSRIGYGVTFAADSGERVRDLAGPAGSQDAIGFARSGRTLIVGSSDGLVTAPDGRVDGSTAEVMALLTWRVGDLSLPGFVGWPRAHVPGLLAAVWQER